MKKTLLNVLSGLLCAALVIGAVCIGSVRGWQRERDQALTTLTDELSAGLEERAMDAANLSVVVTRHLDDSDERLIRLREIQSILANDRMEAPDLIAADADLTELAQSLGQSLPELASVQASARDQAYISALTRTLGENTGISNAYQLLAEGFNNSLMNAPTGWIARLFGVTTIDAQ